MTKAKYIPGVKGMLVEKPLMHRPARLTFWAVWCRVTKKGKKASPDIGLFCPEYQGTPMLFCTKAEAQRHIGRDWRRGVPVKVAMRVTSGKDA